MARFQTYPKVRDTGNSTDPPNVDCANVFGQTKRGKGALQYLGEKEKRHGTESVKEL